MKYKVGDRVVDMWGLTGVVISTTYDHHVYKVLVSLHNGTNDSYTPDGRFRAHDEPTLRLLTPLDEVLK